MSSGNPHIPSRWVSDTYAGVSYTLTSKGGDVTSPSGDFTLDQLDNLNSYRFGHVSDFLPLRRLGCFMGSLAEFSVGSNRPRSASRRILGER